MQHEPQYRVTWRHRVAEKVEVLRNGEWTEDEAARKIMNHGRPETLEWSRHCMSFGPFGMQEKDFRLMTLEYDGDGRRIHGNADDA